MNLVDDLNTLTTIPVSNLKRLVDVSNLCISHQVNEDILNDIDVTEIDIGVGTLYIKYNSNAIKYKFKPSLALNKHIVESVNGNDSLISKLENVVTDKVMKTYKELL